MAARQGHTILLVPNPGTGATPQASQLPSEQPGPESRRLSTKTGVEETTLTLQTSPPSFHTSGLWSENQLGDVTQAHPSSPCPTAAHSLCYWFPEKQNDAAKAQKAPPSPRCSPNLGSCCTSPQERCLGV